MHPTQNVPGSHTIGGRGRYGHPRSFPRPFSDTARRQHKRRAVPRCGRAAAGRTSASAKAPARRARTRWQAGCPACPTRAQPSPPTRFELVDVAPPAVRTFSTTSRAAASPPPAPAAGGRKRPSSRTLPCHRAPRSKRRRVSRRPLRPRRSRITRRHSRRPARCSDSSRLSRKGCRLPEARATAVGAPL